MTVINEMITIMSAKVNPVGFLKYERGLKDMMKQATRMVTHVHKQFSSMGSSFKITVQMMKDTWGLKLSQMTASVSKFTQNTIQKMQVMAAKSRASMAGIQSSASHLRNLMAGGLAAVGIGATAGNFSESIKQYESYRAALKTSTGDMDKAGKKYLELEGFANQYGQRTDSIAKSFLRLNNLDLDSSNKALLAYGNIAAGTPGKGVIDFVEAVADAVTGENERLKEFGIKAKTTGDTVTYTLGNMTKTVKRDGKSIERGLQELISAKFGTAMADQANTPAAAMARLSNRTDKMFRNIWNAGVNKEGAALFKSLDKLMIRLEKDVPKAVMATIKTLKAMKPALSFIMDSLPIIGFGIGVFTARMIGLKIITGGLWLARAAYGFATMGRAAMLANLAAFAIPVAIGAVVLAVGWLSYEIYKFATTGKGWIADLAKEFPEFGVMVKDLGNLFNEWKPKILEILETLRIMAIDGLVWMGTTGIAILRYGLIPVVVHTWEIFKTLWEVGKWVFDNIVGALGDMSQGFMDWKNNLQTAVDAAKEILGTLVGAFNSVKNAAGSIWNGLTGGGGAAAGSGSIAAVAKAFVNKDASGMSDSDRWMKSAHKNNGFLTKELAVGGIACAQWTEEVVKGAGAMQVVLDALNASAGGSMNNLRNKGLAIQVPYDQIQPGDIFYAPDAKYGASHTGVVIDKTHLAHASNGNAGLGLGQRGAITGNYLRGNGIYLRIKPEFMGGQAQSAMPSVQKSNPSDWGGINAPLTQNFYGPANREQVKQAAKDGTNEVFTRAGLGRAGSASPNRS